MSSLKDEITFFSKVYETLEANVRATLDSETIKLRDIIASKSPTSSGRYKRSWRVNKTRGVGMIASSMIFNPLPQAPALEFGVNPSSKHPWVVAHGRGSSSLTEAAPYGSSRIWSSKAVGGSMLKSFSVSRQQRIVDAIAEAALRAFK